MKISERMSARDLTISRFDDFTIYFVLMFLRWWCKMILAE